MGVLTMAKESVTLEFEPRDIAQAQQIASDQNLTVKQWMEREIIQAIQNGTAGADKPTPKPRKVIHRIGPRRQRGNSNIISK
jgi:hypothetical protein